MDNDINNNQSNENNSAEEETPLAFIASDYFLSSGPENQQLLSIGQGRRKKRRKRQHTRRKAKRIATDESIDNINDEKMIGKTSALTLAKSVNAKLKKARPKYFLSVRLDSQGIQKHFNEFSNYVTKKFPEYKKLLINPQQIHITLFVLHLGNDDSIGNAKNCLSNSKEIMKESCPNCKPSLHFQGIDIFDKGRIVYTEPKNDDDLAAFTKLTYALHEKFQREGLVDDDIKKQFKPHATLMKLRRKTIIKHRDGEKKEVIKRIPPEIYEHFKEFDFGIHCLESVELSSMLLPKDDDGYYIRLANLEF